MEKIKDSSVITKEAYEELVQKYEEDYSNKIEEINQLLKEKMKQIILSELGLVKDDNLDKHFAEMNNQETNIRKELKKIDSVLMRLNSSKRNYVQD